MIITPRAHLQSTVERPGNGDALCLGLARRDGPLQLVQVTVLLQLLHEALERKGGIASYLRP